MKAGMIGVPLDLGARNLGVDVGPNAVRYRKIVEKLRGAGIEVEDVGDIECYSRKSLAIGDDRLRFLDEILRVSEEVADKAEYIAGHGKKLIGLGGDHSITLGLFSGVRRVLKDDVGMIYFDAHGDMNTDKTTFTGNIHGMHLAALMGFGDKRLVDSCGEGRKLSSENLLHIGGCDFDQAELDLVKREKIKIFQVEDILRFGMQPLFGLIDELRSRVKYTYISLDLDSIDSLYAPGAGMINRGGLSYREIVALANYIGSNCNIVGVDIVEYNPLQDEDYKTVELGIELIARFLGKNYSWYSEYLKDNKI